MNSNTTYWPIVGQLKYYAEKSPRIKLQFYYSKTRSINLHKNKISTVMLKVLLGWLQIITQKTKNNKRDLVKIKWHN